MEHEPTAAYSIVRGLFLLHFGIIGTMHRQLDKGLIRVNRLNQKGCLNDLSLTLV